MFEVSEYTSASPQISPSDGQKNVVVIAHDLARPAQVAAAMANADNDRTIKLLTVLDARSFLDDWERDEWLPLALREAGRKDARAHLHDKKACEVLAEHVESADVLVLTHTDAADPDELEMLEAMLLELNPSAAVVRRAGHGDEGGKRNQDGETLLAQLSAQRSSERPAPPERGG